MPQEREVKARSTGVGAPREPSRVCPGRVTRAPSLRRCCGCRRRCTKRSRNGSWTPAEPTIRGAPTTLSDGFHLRRTVAPVGGGRPLCGGGRCRAGGRLRRAPHRRMPTRLCREHERPSPTRLICGHLPAAGWSVPVPGHAAGRCRPRSRDGAVIRLRLAAGDLERLRFAYSPLAEVAESLYVLGCAATRPCTRHGSTRSGCGCGG
jgi:hypothetical protein